MDGLGIFFAFPLNLMIVLLWVTGCRWLWKVHPDCRVTRFLLSPAATISSMSLLLAACLWLGLTGHKGFVGSVFFAVIMLYVQTVLLMVVFRGWRTHEGKVRWRFLLLHAGLLIAIGAGFWGAPDTCEQRVRLEKGQVTETAYGLDSKVAGLGFSLKLVGFDVDMSPSGTPAHYEAVVSVDGGSAVNITVNHPYGVRFDTDIYLAGISDGCCIFQIVRDPWRYVQLAGILMLLAGAFLLFIKGPGK